MANKRLLIIDAFGILYRYYFIFIKNPLTNSNGMNTSAIHGFMRTYFSLIETYPSDYIVVAVDSTKDTFRRKMYSEYKANRESMPDDLRAQIEPLYNLLDSMGITKIAHNEYEADDIIGTIAKANKKNNIDTLIYSPDKDIMQLVNDSTHIVSSSRENSLIEYDENGVFEKRGVAPNRIIDLLALMGDASDNIPGVKGVGEKTALKLLEEYDSLDGVYENIESISGKLKEKLIADKDNAYLSYKLATIELDMPIDIDYEKYTIKKVDSDNVIKILDTLELNQVRKKILEYIDDPNKAKEMKEARVKTEEKPNIITNVSYYRIENEIELDNMISEINSKKIVAVDFETTGLNVFQDKIIGIAFSYKENEAFYLDISGRTNIDCDKCLEKVFQLFASKDINIIGHNLKYEYQMLKSIGKSFSNIYFDTMIAAYLISSGKYKYSLDDLASEYLSYKMTKYKDITDKGKLTLLDVDINVVVAYACEDADMTFRLYKIFKPLLKQHNLENIFYKLELPLLIVLAEMEYKGVFIDKDKLNGMSEEYSKKLSDAMKNIYNLAGEEFNVQSPKQVANILFNKLGLPTIKKIQTGYSTDEAVLTELSKKHEIARHLLTYRKYAKLKNTYIDVLPTLIEEKTGRVHSSYNQTVTATGRLSSSEPNFQNIPIRDDDGKKIRGSFIPEKGNVLIAADYSQIELRLLAHFTADKNLVEAFNNNEDIHKRTAMKMYSVKEEHITNTMRSIAKVINFSIIYGKTAFGLSRELDISRKEAESFIKGYFSMYSDVKPYFDKVLDDVREKLEVRTMLDRRRDFTSTINNKNASIRNEAERMAINTVIQGSAADLIKIAMIDLNNKFKNDFKNASIIMQVHDELVVEVAENESEHAMEVVKDSMENAYKLTVPLLVDIVKGYSWGEIH